MDNEIASESVKYFWLDKILVIISNDSKYCIRSQKVIFAIF